MSPHHPHRTLFKGGAVVTNPTPLTQFANLVLEGKEWIRQRGLIRAAMQRYGPAVTDLERYLECAPNAPDRSIIGDQVRALQKKRSTLN